MNPDSGNNQPQDPIAVWREAAKDEQHPRYKAVWTLFGGEMKPAAAAKRLADQKETVIPWLLEILDIEELAEEGSFGNGDAPINAAGLLGEWRVTEAIPRLMEMYVEGDIETILHSRVSTALLKMGSAVIDPMLELGKRERGDMLTQVGVCSIMIEADSGDPRVYPYIQDVFERCHEPIDIEFIGEALLYCQPERGADYLDARMKQVKYPASTRSRLEKYIAMARKGEFVRDSDSSKE
jgi:hypothetical protein